MRPESNTGDSDEGFSSFVAVRAGATDGDIEEGIPAGAGTPSSPVEQVEVISPASTSDQSYSAFVDFLEVPSSKSSVAAANNTSNSTKSVDTSGLTKNVSDEDDNSNSSSFGKETSVDTTDLTKSVSDESLYPYMPAKSNTDVLDDTFQGNNDGDAHGHAAPTFISKLASSIVCFIIYFVFCIVFSSVVWDPLNSSLDKNIDPPFGVPQGVGINLMGIAVGSVFFAWRSGCKGIMAGPDLLPVVFFAEAGASVMAYLVKEYSDQVSTAASDCTSSAGHRFLGGDSGGASDPCSDVLHRSLASDGPALGPDTLAMLVPTTLVAMMIGNAITGLLFYGLGKMKNTASVIGFIPASVVAGFLTCIGYKVIKLAVLITTGYSFKQKYIHNLNIDIENSAHDPWLPLTIAILYGVLLYGIKHLHVVAAEKLILGFIVVPLVIFFPICAISGVTMEELRQDDWFLTQGRDGLGCEEACAFTRTNFWQTLQVAYGSSDLVAWGAIPRCIPIFIMGSCMTSLDSMLKLTSSEKALGVDLDYNHEMKLGGKATLVSSILAGSPAYGQTKFNVINLSIAKTSDSLLPTLLLGAISMLVFIAGLAGPIINIMPRFLLGGLCVFAGVGFLYENLWEGRKNMNRVSFAIVWIIFLVNFVWEFFLLQNLPKDIQPMVPGLLVVFILGIVLSTFEFMFAFMHKAKAPEVRGGKYICSSAVRSKKHDNQLAVMAPWFAVFSVESFVFFGTANALYQQLKAFVADEKENKPKAERTKYLIFDLSEVTGIDSSAKDVFFKVHRFLKTEGIHLIWALTKKKLATKFENWGLYAGTRHFVSLDLALRNVEDELLIRAKLLSEKWLVNETVRSIFERQVLANVFNISVRTNERRFSSARLQPWSQRITILQGQELCGPEDDNLYMLYAGEIELTGRDDSRHAAFPGSFFNMDHLLVSIGALPGPISTISGTATVDSMVLVVTKESFLSMQREDGALAQKLLMTLIVQNESNRPGRIRPEARNRVEPSTERNISDSARRSGAVTLASRVLSGGDDYKIGLTDAQIESFLAIFNLILELGEDEVPMDRFSSYVSMEARALGSAMDHKQFMSIIDASGIDEDGDGMLSKDEFVSFLRGLFLADIPSAEVDALRKEYDAAVAIAPNAPMDESRILVLFASLGFDIEICGMSDVIGVIDADGDGDVDFSEFLTGIGMLKQFCIQSKKLDQAFSDFKNESNQAKSRLSLALPSSNTTPQSQRPLRMPAMLSSTKGISQRKMVSLSAALVVSDSTSGSGDGGVELDASDLEAFFNVSRIYAEEMVFLADRDEVEAVRNEGESTGEVISHRSIDRDEFQQLIRSWS